MNCEHAVGLISARLDREVAPDDRALLELHLRDCPACRAVVEAFALQDRELRHTFEPRRRAVAATATEVAAALTGYGLPPAPVVVPARLSVLHYPAVRFALAVGAVAASLALIVFSLRKALPLGQPPTPPAPLVVVGPPAVPTNLSLAEVSRLTPRQLSNAPAPKVLNVGDTLTTKAGERIRVALPDKSLLYVNQDSQVHVDAGRKVRLDRGEVFVEVVPAGAGGASFVVQTPKHAVTALGTKFEVRAEEERVVVTQGKVQVDGVGEVDAGQSVGADGKVGAAPRASHLLDWTRDLMADAESPLVPASAHGGGALVAVDGNGQEARLSLRRFTVDVHVEDGFARTTIDQTYFNHHPWRLEGTFFFPLPPDASLCRLAMYVDGNLMEGGIAERGHARAVYQRIVNNQKDPALLEWVDGSTFKMRVFPLEGRQEKRIILSYTQRVPGLYGRSTYRFPAGHSLQTVGEWSFKAVVKNGKALAFNSPTHPEMEKKEDGADLVLTCKKVAERGEGILVNRDVVVNLSASAGSVATGPLVRFNRAELDGSDYLAVRYRPELTGRPTRQRRDWVFLVESSADRDPLLARTQIEILRNLLANVEHDDTFVVLAAATRSHLSTEQRVPATPENVAAALNFLERGHLIGALDLGRAFRTASTLLDGAENPYLVHLGSGMTAIGTRQDISRDDALAKELPKGVRYVGVGVGKRWNRAWMKEQAEKTGGYFTQINPDETVSWRAFELLATLNTPRLLDVKVTAKTKGSSGDAPRFLADVASLAQGEELFAVARLDDPANKPQAVTVTGVVDGKPFSVELAVQDVVGGAGYLPRTWAKLEIDRLLLDRQTDRREEVIKLSKAMVVMTPFTSMLVLENDAMYDEFKVDRGRKDHWAMYACPAKVDVGYDPLPTEFDARNAPTGLKPHPNQVRGTVLTRGAPRWLTHSRDGNRPARRSEVVADFFELGLDNAESENDSLAYGLQPGAAERLGDVNDPALYFERSGINAISRQERGVEGLDGSRKSRLDDMLFRSESARIEGRNEGFARASGRLRLGRELGQKKERELFESGLPGSPRERELLRAGNGMVQHWNLTNSDVTYGFGGGNGGRSRMFGLGVNSDGGLTGSVVLNERNFNGEFATSYNVDRLSELSVDYAMPVGGTLPALALTPDGRSLLSGRLQSKSELTIAENDGDSPVDLGLKRRLLTDHSAPLLTLDRLRFTNDERLFTDLVAYAPGLNSGGADLRAVLEEEAAPNLRTAPGNIDTAARKLIDGTRRPGWHALTLGGEKSANKVVLLYDDEGRYAWERTVGHGLRERVVCDGKTLLHLYPEIGVGARRTATRFHRAELADLVPWWLPPATDLARGCDVLLVNERTVALEPHYVKDLKPVDGKPAPYARTHLVFAADGRLAEKHLVEMPANKVHVREVYDGKGGMRLLDAEGKEFVKSTRELKAVDAPDLKPATSGLVVLPLPFRSREHVMRQYGLEPGQNLGSDVNGCHAYLEEGPALELLGALLATNQNPNEASLLVRACFFDRGDVRPGLFTLLGACNVNVAAEPAFRTEAAKTPDAPLMRYLALFGNTEYRYLLRRFPLALGGSVAAKDSFFGKLAVARDLVERWRHRPNVWLHLAERRADVARTAAFVTENRQSPLGWALLLHMQHAGGHSADDYAGMARLWRAMDDARHPSFHARYEAAFCVDQSGHRPEARKLFQALYAGAMQSGRPPAVDYYFYSAMVGQAGDDDQWTPLMRDTARRLLEMRGGRVGVVFLAWQAYQLDDRTLADNLLAVALDGVPDAERFITHLAAVEFLTQTTQLARADDLVRGLLQDDKRRRDPDLWRLAARLADQRGHEARTLACLEQALDLEYADLPDVIYLEGWRHDYGRLLGHYKELATKAAELHAAPPADLAARVVRAADRWRAHDPEADAASRQAGEILRLLGPRELAWDYLTTPFAGHPEQAGNVRDLAVTLGHSGATDLAESAWAVATDVNPDDPQILWDRAMNLRQAGRADEAKHWLRKLADGDGGKDWNWRHVRDRARFELNRK